MSNLANFTIFVIEDDPQQVKMIKESIEKKFPAFTILSYPTGEDALQHMNERPDMVILDHLLNSVDKNAMDGLTVLHKMKSIDKNVPVIIFSAQESPDISARTIKSGAYDYIVKNQQSFEKLESIIKHFSSHIILDSKLILKKLNVVLLVIAALIAILTCLFMMNK